VGDVGGVCTMKTTGFGYEFAFPFFVLLDEKCSLKESIIFVAPSLRRQLLS
jgi:hypothetical protein